MERITLETYLFWLTKIEDSNIKKKHCFKIAQEGRTLRERYFQHKLIFKIHLLKQKMVGYGKQVEKDVKNLAFFEKKD